MEAGSTHASRTGITKAAASSLLLFHLPRCCTATTPSQIGKRSASVRRKGRLDKQREGGLADADIKSVRSLARVSGMSANKKSHVLPNRTGMKRWL